MGESLYFSHDHEMIPCTDVRQGDCCGRFAATSDGYYCETCDFIVHKNCGGILAPHIHEHVMEPWYGRKGDCCGGFEVTTSEGYYCQICKFFVHIKCGGVSLPMIHQHLMMPWNDLRKGDCCGRFEAISDGYYCKICDFFVHKECGESSEFIDHSSHSNHTLRLQIYRYYKCNFCGRNIGNLFYRCKACDFNMDLCCAKYPPPEVIDIPETHGHMLTLVKERIEFHCDAECGKFGDGFHYKCHECDLSFHIDCVWQPPSEVKHPLEVNHSYHPLHALKLLKGGPPEYSNGKCRLCGRKIDDKLLYHCSSCDFSLDMRCVLNPPEKTLLDLNTHEHQLTLIPKLISFTCSVCGLNGDQSPYMCIECGFMIHKDCFGLPRVININRHDHRVLRTSILGVVNSVCGICHQKVDWTCGGYSCHKCPGYVVHSKCATRKDVWNGKELEGIPEEAEDVEPYVIIDDNTIQHFSHKEHYLRLNSDGIVCEVNKWCSACNHPICLQPFYRCMVCDFILHQNCAELPKRKWHVLHNERLTLETSKPGLFTCHACNRDSNGFKYQDGDKKLDVRCGSFSEPFNHPSHPQHPLYFVYIGEGKVCNGCNIGCHKVLICIEDDCGFVLDFECATLPRVVKHRVYDHPLSLCYGEKASGKYWCDICEQETNPNTWFYTCKDHQASLHTWCVLGYYTGLMPGSTVSPRGGGSYEVVLNNSMTRPFCRQCKSRCIKPVAFKMLGWYPSESDIYFCSLYCQDEFWREEVDNLFKAKS